MKKISFSIWNSTAKTLVESLFQKLPFVTIPLSMENDPLEIIENNLKSTQYIIADLCKLIEEHTFQSETEETLFFKQIKPLFSGSLIYWERLQRLYLQMPIGGEAILRKYYKRKLKNLKAFHALQSGFYEYLRGNYDYLDNLYFLRTSRSFEESVNSVDLNPKFTTVKDRLVGEIYANELLEQYIHGLLNKHAEISTHADKDFPALQWTGSRAGLVELIYALQSSGVYNHGQIGIGQLADSFQQLFNVDLGNYYHVFTELRLRKKSRTALLDHLKERVIQKMDTMDEK